jgi:hypothetical protein
MSEASTALLVTPNGYNPHRFDAETRRLLRATIDWFESRGKRKLAEDYHAKAFYADFLEFAGKEGLFSTCLTPAANADGNRTNAGTPVGSPSLRKFSGSTGSTTGTRGRSQFWV